MRSRRAVAPPQATSHRLHLTGGTTSHRVFSRIHMPNQCEEPEGPVASSLAAYPASRACRSPGDAMSPFFYFWNLEQSSAEKAGVRPTYQAPFQEVVTSPLPTPLGAEQNFVFLSLRVSSPHAPTPPLVGEVECYQEIKRGKPRNLPGLYVRPQAVPPSAPRYSRAGATASTGTAATAVSGGSIHVRTRM